MYIDLIYQFNDSESDTETQEMILLLTIVVLYCFLFFAKLIFDSLIENLCTVNSKCKIWVVYTVGLRKILNVDQAFTE